MKTRLWITMVAAMVAVAVGSVDFAFGGGRGGGYDYSQPLLSYSDSGTSAAPADAATAAATTQAEPTDEGMTAFNDARTAFDDGNAAKALTLLDTNPSQFLFKMIGGDEKDPGLQFKKG